MDPQGAFAIAILLTLLNGAVLGMMHRDLPPDLRPSALSWLSGTLLISLGCILLALQNQFPLWLALPLANLLICAGLTFYWYSMRQFYGRSTSFWMFAPAFATLPLTYWFTAHDPDMSMRVLLTSVASAFVLGGAIHTLWRARDGDQAISRRVLFVTTCLLVGFLVLRTGVFLFSSVDVGSVVDGSHWINMLTPLIVSILPVVGTTAFLQMCSERIRRYWELAASTDALTGLANRRTLVHEGALRLEAARRNQRDMALGVIDIDHFKKVNDAHGHDIGDLALIHVAETIARACRPGDLAARQGGEEFVILLDDIDGDTALRRAEQLRETVERTLLQLPDRTLSMTVSIGLATNAADAPNLDALLRRADQALYRAKAEGRNRVMAA